jgi:hypothetical protein
VSSRRTRVRGADRCIDFPNRGRYLLVGTRTIVPAVEIRKNTVFLAQGALSL